MAADLVDADDFDTGRDGWSPQQVWREIPALLPRKAAGVFTHGNYLLDNVLVSYRAIAGCIK